MLCSIRYIDWWTSGHNSNSGSLSLSFSLSLPFLGFKQFSAQHFQTWDHQIIHSIISTIAMWKPLISQLVGYGVFVNRLMSTTPTLAKHCLPRHPMNSQLFTCPKRWVAGYRKKHTDRPLGLISSPIRATSEMRYKPGKLCTSSLQTSADS